MSHLIIEDWTDPPDPATVRGWGRGPRRAAWPCHLFTPLWGLWWVVAEGTPRVEVRATDDARLQVYLDGQPAGAPSAALDPALLYHLTVTLAPSPPSMTVRLAAEGRAVPAGADRFCARCGWIGRAAAVGPVCPACAAPVAGLPSTLRREGD